MKKAELNDLVKKELLLEEILEKIEPKLKCPKGHILSKEGDYIRYNDGIYLKCEECNKYYQIREYKGMGTYADAVRAMISTKQRWMDWYYAQGFAGKNLFYKELRKLKQGKLDYYD